ncbi:hypothetical protein PQQ32_11790 [Brachyspira hyodysenteriae]|uniref:hypothetical protein n=1 Tax=Brachyspira hyodysenteriae TaxID=159 RepID=UPI002B258D4F|nr:hypothetical protein [Brachyspira hyodysenteriae]WPC37558.1 hypothetical protein PQQ32_11790 [Brachyspira hyodysenteriae]
MNKFILALMLSIVMLILCAANTKSDKKTKYENTKTEVIGSASIDIKNNSYTNIDKYVIKTLDAYKVYTNKYNDIINLNGNKYYISSVYTLNIDDESFYEKLENEHYIYVSLWKLNNNNANFVAGFYPFTMYSYDVEYIKPYISNNMLEFEILRYARKYEYIDYYKFAIIETNNIINFYLTNFTEKTPEYDYKTDETKISEYSFDKDNIIMNNLNKNYDY